MPKWLLSAVVGGLAGGVVGYFVTRYQLWQSDIAERVSKLCDRIEEVEDLACEYWMIGNPDTHAAVFEQRITGLLHKISAELNDLAESRWIFSPATSDELIELRKAITGDQFGVRWRDEDSDRCARIHLAATNLQIAIKKIRRSLI